METLAPEDLGFSRAGFIRRAAHQQRRVEGALLAAPESLGGSTCVFQISVPDVDAAFTRAVDEGGSPALPPTSMFGETGTDC